MATSSKSQQFWPNLQLNNGNEMPAVGLGTYRMKDPDIILHAVDDALAAGYRLFDTASVYGNEVYLRMAFDKLLPKYDLKRDDLFITSKLSNAELGSKRNAIRAYERSLKNLGVEYLDLYLIHYPGAAKLSPTDIRNREMRNVTWTGLTELYDEGKVSSIGVSNFTVNHLEDFITQHQAVVPAVNQLEWHPHYFSQEVYDYASHNDVVLQAYHSLGGTSSKGALLQDTTVQTIARTVSATPAQVLLVWALQKNIGVIPKATTKDRIQENIKLDFKLSAEDMKQLDNLHRQVKYAWDPTSVY